MGQTDQEIVEVAVGVLRRADGSFLLTQRPPGKPMPGYWEFPGGKLEPGESVGDALVREFKEELDIIVEDAAPWVVRTHVYAHATVRLHFWCAQRWQGIPRALEGQGVRWEHIDDLLVEPWLPGALILKRWLALPALYAISAAAELGERTFLARLDARLAHGGLKQLQLREKSLDEIAFARLFVEVRARCVAHGVRLLINSDHPRRFWEEADGVHCTSAFLMRQAGRPGVPWCIASCHSEAELARAHELDFDAAVLGPVCATRSHQDAQPLQWDGFSALVRAAPLPVYAIGGLTAGDQALARAQGAQGVAIKQAAWLADYSSSSGSRSPIA